MSLPLVVTTSAWSKSWKNHIHLFSTYSSCSNDNFNQIDKNVSTVIDLLEYKHISWAAYQEDMPYTGFEGFAWVNQETQANDYVRKHNPPVIFNSVADSKERLSKIKNLTEFYYDLEHDKLPQWMFITPNVSSIDASIL